MDYKDIVEKALKGEDYSELVKGFDDVKIKEVNQAITKASKAEADAELAKVTALRAEKRRLETPPPPKPEDGPQGQLRVENVQLAKDKFFADPKFKLTEVEQAQFDAEFKKLDSGKIAPELIIQDLKKAFAVVKSDTLISSQDRISEFEKNAAEFNAGQAGGSGGTGSPDDAKYSQAAKNLHKAWLKAGIKDKTLDDAQKQTERGADWKQRSLSS